MKIFFDFNLYRQSFFCHEIAKYWKKKYGIKDFAGMVAVKNGDHFDFLNNQNEIKYHFLDNRDVIEEDALKIELDVDRVDEIEKKLNIPLWYFIVADRNIGHFFVNGVVSPKTQMMDLANHENIMRWIVYYYDLIDKRMEEFKPDAVIFLAIASLPSLMLAKICEMKGIPYYILESSRINKLYTINKNNCKGINDKVKKDYESIINSVNPSKYISEFASEYVDSFERNPKEPWYAESNKKIFRDLNQRGNVRIILYFFLEFTKTVAKKAITYFNKNKGNFYLRKKNEISNLYIKARRDLIVKNSVRNIFDYNINPNEKYVFFPLHVNPEASTMIFAPNFVNQLNVIDIIAKNIPMTHKLYVKEHIPSIGTRPNLFYEEIKKYPNIKLINPWEDTFNLIKNSSLVVTVSGTVGWEALLLKIPVITLAETFYSAPGLAMYCSDIDKLGREIKKRIYYDSVINKEKTDINVKAMTTAIHKNSFEADATSLVWGENKNVKDTLLKMRDDVSKISESLYDAITNNK